MNGSITVTKAAPAYLELEADEQVEIFVGLVTDILPPPISLGIGLSVIYLVDGTTMNVRESVQQVQLKMIEVGRHYFEYRFSKN